MSRRGFQGTVMRALGAHEHVITATDVADVVRGFRRVTFTSDTLFDDFVPGPAEFLRLWVADPDDPDREVQRGYTVIEADPTTNSFAIDFVIHEPVGPASAWASQCSPGDEVSAVRVFGGSAGSALRQALDGFVEFLGGWQRPFVAKKALVALYTDAMTFLAIIVVAGGWLVASERMGAADLLPFLLLGTTFGGRLLALAYNAAGLRESKAAAQRIGIALTEAELVTSPTATGESDGAGTVRLQDVTFGYRPGEPVLHDIDLTLPAGTVTALVGPSGSGKSTLAALVARFHDPDVGAVTIDGVDLRELTTDDLYQRVGFVLQGDQLVRASLHDNIALARPDADREAVRAAADAAQLGDVVARLPDGLDTEIGGDIALSGGEAQRVAIARAILADPPIVVLDEATAFADPESEYQVQSALSRLFARRTVLMIAHRLHTIVDADNIVVVDHGRIVQSSTHDELIGTAGRYAAMWAPLREAAPS